MGNILLDYSKRLVSIPLTPMVDERSLDMDVKGVDNDLLHYIYGNDPNNGAPIGDLSIYLGENANPEIKRYIEMNLLNENPQNEGLSLSTDQLNAMNKVITDDDIAFFSRNHDETKEEYALRLRNYLEDAKARRAKYKADKEYRDLINRIANGK